MLIYLFSFISKFKGVKTYEQSLKKNSQSHTYLYDCNHSFYIQDVAVVNYLRDI